MRHDGQRKEQVRQRGVKIREGVSAAFLDDFPVERIGALRVALHDLGNHLLALGLRIGVFALTRFGHAGKQHKALFAVKDTLMAHHVEVKVAGMDVGEGMGGRAQHDRYAVPPADQLALRIFQLLGKAAFRIQLA